jgi:catechol 2,3-dioxygenase-like lactoylglutathione lyase family enzyme
VSKPPRARAIGLNHVALVVGDLEEALRFYGTLFEVRLRGRGPEMAFIDIGDQFIALAEGRGEPGREPHFGLVVDDREAVRTALAGTAARLLPGRGLDFLDPWGNHVQVVSYRDVQFTKAPEVLQAMAVEDPGKSERALAELRAKGVEV